MIGHDARIMEGETLIVPVTASGTCRTVFVEKIPFGEHRNIDRARGPA
jgi:hypothetical protein